MDANLTRLEGRTKSNAVRYGRIAAVGLAAVVVAGVAFLIYRRTRRPSPLDRLAAWRRGLNLKERLPSVTLRVNERVEEEPGMVETIVREVAPALVGTAGSALLGRLAAEPDE